ncbi:diphosphomevalonate/mevalonate 3,5-bisphosphate decarboxylase family protein [Nonlabens marinus]|uniref:Diphosphomevalonate decarboxylase n=1 Tax=Nonlabens marinus S1-08 TaxID=1454201 RepID=W8VVG4_9FLAO|nr:diphosphomevalonate decarboxylase [Nonlabens marinus]BAO55423.1 diphosphomevalonate decarboxylase [Nonlabens marinus S1-08]
MEDQFILHEPVTLVDQLSASWQAPSNIALVKYWGKHGVQLPANPSISFTLSDCKTITTLTAIKAVKHGFEIKLDGKLKPSFAPKIESYFKRIISYSPWIKEYYFTIETTNTFPHSSGIASSASSMAALSSCIVDLESQLTGTDIDLKKASFLARLGSGSACRSLEGKLVVWGSHDETSGSSDLFGVDVSQSLHAVFQDYQDTILLVDKGEKTVSSTVGHELMNEHAFAKARFHQAHSNLTAIKECLYTGDLDGFIKITESEALTLHAMMMTSHPYFILMKPNTLSIIEEIWAYRKETGVPVCFTLDAGANVHMLYPAAHKDTVEQLIKSKLAQYCQNEQYICDAIGSGATAV